MKLLASMYAVLFCAACCAQPPVTYTVKAGVSILDVVPAKDIYQYPDFITGTVVFKDGLSTQGRLNYNSLIAEIQFIDAKGDTLSLANEETVRHILMAADTFYYSEGYVRLVTGSSSVKLGEKVIFKEFVQKPGAYGLSSSTTATNNLTALLDKKSVDLNVSQEVVLVKHTSWLIGNRFNEFVPADKKGILKMFSRKKPAIEDYLKNNEVNYNKKEDLLKLVSFLKNTVKE